MTKQSGLGDHLYVDGYALGGDINSLGAIRGGPAPWEVTDITQSAVSRIGLLFSAEMQFTSYFNPASNRAHDILSSLPTGTRYASYLRGLALGSPIASMLAKQINYDPTRGADGSLTLVSSLQSTDQPLLWGSQATPGVRTDTAATNGSSLDLGAAATGGLVCFLHVEEFAGTSVTIKLQSSSDNGAGDAWADVTGGAFAVVSSAPLAERLVVPGTVERYIRVVTTGTFSNAKFVVGVSVA